MPNFEVEYDYTEYIVEEEWDDFLDEWVEEEVPHYYTETIVVEADSAEAARDIARDDLYYKDGLSVGSATLVDEEDV